MHSFEADQGTQTFLELVNLYPSPHNGQPVKLTQIDENSFVLLFDKQRGLQSTEISYIFSFVSMGIFLEHMSMCAKALGHAISFELELPKENSLRGSGAVKFASCKLAWNTEVEDKNLLQALRFRRTSRKKYLTGITKGVADKINQIAATGHMTLAQLDGQKARQTIWLNQRAVFDDMFNEKVRSELNHWLRYSEKQKQEHKDGLAYDCMEINGPTMKFIVNHPKTLRIPGIAKLLKQYYLRTMTDQSDVFYMLAPFATEKNSFDVGLVIMKIWIEISRNEFYLHPFGTIMSNNDAHVDFLKMANIHNESRAKNYLVFILRAGKSVKPAPSLRIPFNKHLLEDKQNV